MVDIPLKPGLNSLIFLGAWLIWNQRSDCDCVFSGDVPSLQTVFSIACKEARLWGLAGVKGLLQIAATGP